MRRRTEISVAVGHTVAAMLLLGAAGCREEATEVHGAPMDQRRTVVQEAPANVPAAPADTGAVSASPPASPVSAAPAAPAPKPTAAPRSAKPAAPKSAAEAPASKASAPAAPTATSPSSPPPGAISDPRFAVWMQPSGSYRAGQQGSVEVVLSCKEEWHCNEKYPIKFTCDAPSADVAYPQPVVRKDAIAVTTERATAKIPFVPANAGPTKVSGKLSFSVCTETQCVVETRPLSATVSVQ